MLDQMTWYQSWVQQPPESYLSLLRLTHLHLLRLLVHQPTRQQILEALPRVVVPLKDLRVPFDFRQKELH